MPLIIEKQGDGYVANPEGNLIEWTLGSVTKPLTLEPVGGGQAAIFGGLAFVMGGVLGATVFRKSATKLAGKMGFKTDEHIAQAPAATVEVG